MSFTLDSAWEAAQDIPQGVWFGLVGALITIGVCLCFRSRSQQASSPIKSDVEKGGGGVMIPLGLCDGLAGSMLHQYQTSPKPKTPAFKPYTDAAHEASDSPYAKTRLPAVLQRMSGY